MRGQSKRFLIMPEYISLALFFPNVDLCAYAEDIDNIRCNKRDVTNAFIEIQRKSIKMGMAINKDKTKYIVNLILRPIIILSMSSKTYSLLLYLSLPTTQDYSVDFFVNKFITNVHKFYSVFPITNYKIFSKFHFYALR